MSCYKVYCDESRQNNCQYKLISGIWINKDSGWPFVNDFNNKCIQEVGIEPAHMKWKNVPSKPDSPFFPFYKIFVDLYFQYCYRGKMFFRTIIANKDYQFNHSLYNNGDPEIGFYKLYYQLIFHWLDADCLYHIRIAQREVSKKVQNIDEAGRLDDLNTILNNGINKKYNRKKLGQNIISTQARPAKSRRLIQLADILMGAVGYHWNGEHLKPEASKGKIYLSNYIANKLHRKDLKFISRSATEKTFNIFFLNPK